MAIDPSLIAPKAPVSPAPAPQPDPAETASAPEAPAATDSQNLPDELVQIPAMQAVLAGNPAAVSAPLAEFSKRPEAKIIIDNKDALVAAGFGLYRSLSGDVGVVFNTLHLHPDELKAADKAGKLQQLAPPFDQVNASVAGAGPDTHPVLNAAEVPTGPKGPPMPNPPQMNSGAMNHTPAAVQRTVATARTNNLNPGSPTSGPQPGAGRILNSILKPVV
jgi:hypothetical protein